MREQQNDPGPRMLHRHRRFLTHCSLVTFAGLTTNTNVNGLNGGGVGCIELMRSGSAVAAPRIAALRETYHDFATCFRLHSDGVIASVKEQPDRAHELNSLGARVTKSYRPDVLLPEWQAYLEQLGRLSLS